MTRCRRATFFSSASRRRRARRRSRWTARLVFECVAIQSHPLGHAVHCPEFYATSFAIPNAAAAASPPTTAVCHALRSGFLTVKVPLT